VLVLGMPGTSASLTGNPGPDPSGNLAVDVAHEARTEDEGSERWGSSCASGWRRRWRRGPPGPSAVAWRSVGRVRGPWPKRSAWGASVARGRQQHEVKRPQRTDRARAAWCTRTGG